MSSSKDDIFDLLTPYVDGELPQSEAARVEQTVQASPALQRLVAAERATKHALATRLSRYTAPPGLEQRIRSAIFDAPADVAPRRVSLRWLLGWNPAFASGAAVLALVAAITVVLVLFGARRMTPFIRDVYAHHTDAARFPIHFEGDHESVAQQASAAVGFPVAVPRLGEDIRLIGARKCALCGHLMAFIKYEGQDGQISFFIVPETRPALERLARHECDEGVFYAAGHQELAMIFWHENGMLYAIAAAVGKDRLLELASTASRQVQFAEEASVAESAPLLVLAFDQSPGY